MVGSRNYCHTHSADKKSLNVTIWKWGRTWTQAWEFQTPGFKPVSSDVFCVCLLSTVQWACLRPPCTDSCYSTCSDLSKSVSFWNGKQEQQAARPSMCKHFPSPGWHSKPAGRFQPSQREGSAAARMERLQSFSCKRVRWSIMCTNSCFSLWETSWQELVAGVAGTQGERTFSFLLALVPSGIHDEVAQVEKGSCTQQPSWRPLRENQAEAGGSSRGSLYAFSPGPSRVWDKHRRFVGGQMKTKARQQEVLEAVLTGAKSRAGFMDRHVTPAVTQGPMLRREPHAQGLMLCGCHLKILNNFIFELGFCKSGETMEHVLGLGASAWGGSWLPPPVSSGQVLSSLPSPLPGPPP